MDVNVNTGGEGENVIQVEGVHACLLEMLGREWGPCSALLYALVKLTL